MRSVLRSSCGWRHVNLGWEFQSHRGLFAEEIRSIHSETESGNGAAADREEDFDQVTDENTVTLIPGAFFYQRTHTLCRG